MRKSNQLLQIIIEQLQLGNSLTSICRSKEMPHLATLYKWMNVDKDFKENIFDARRMGAMTWLDKMQDLLDQDIEPQQVQLLREKLTHARWMASKIIPAFNDKVINENIGDPIIKIIWDDGSPEHKGEAPTHTIRGSNKENDEDHDNNTIN